MFAMDSSPLIPQVDSFMPRYLARITALSASIFLIASDRDGVANKQVITGRIVGSVTFEGKKILPATVITNNKDVQTCGTTITAPDVLISQETRGIGNV